MIKTKVEYDLFEQYRNDCPNNKGWALAVSLNGQGRWVIEQWKTKPAGTTVEKVKDIFMQSCRVYHSHITNQFKGAFAMEAA